MDLVRGCAIVLVVCHHSLYLTVLFLGACPEPLLWLDRFWEPFRMPALVFLSGMLLHKSLRKPPLQFISGKARALAWPYWLWSLMFLGMSSGITPDTMLRVLLVPPTYLWYLWYLFAYYLVALAITRLGVPEVAVLIVSYGASAFITERYGLANFFYLLVFFLLGHMASVHASRIRCLLGPRWVPVVLMAVSLVVAVLSAAGVEVKFQAPWILGVIAAIGLTIRLAPGLPYSLAGDWLKWIGRNSIVFYLAHWPAMWAACTTLLALGVDAPAMFIGCNLVLGLLAGWVLTMVRRCWPVANALVVWPARTGAYRR
ncbi:acyltransferase [Arthrobacter sp. S13_S34]|nr:acyltransferase [Arthrobacter sp. S13_S34]